MIRFRVFIVALIATLALGFELGVGYAKGDIGDVVVDPSVNNPDRVAQRISDQLVDGDMIAVMVTADEIQRPNLGTILTNTDPGDVLIVVIGKDVWARSNYWVPQVVLDARLDRVKNVNRNSIDQVVALVGQIHQWQSVNRKPAPPAAPPAPPGPPPPPAKPFHMLWWGWVAVGFGVLFALWLPLELRRRHRVALISARADEQADWGFDKYGIKTNLD